MKKRGCILALVTAFVMAATAMPAFAAEDRESGEIPDKSWQQEQIQDVRQVQGEYLVQYKGEAAEPSLVEEELSEYDASVVENVLPDVQLIEADTAALSKKEEIEFVKEVESLDDVEYVEPNIMVRAADTAASAKAKESYEQWGLNKIKAPQAWNKMGVVSGSATVAVVDTGVDGNHPDLKGRVKQGKTFIKRNSRGSAYGQNAWADDEGHGTQVAGIISANARNDIGISGAAGTYAVDILPVKVLDDQGNGSLADVIKGIEYAADQGADVINLSLGFYSYSVFLEKAVQYAQQKGCVLVAASGNEAEELEYLKEAGFSYGLAFPAALDGVLSVGATKKDDKRASFSNYGDGLDVVAPGLFIMSPFPEKIAKTANEEEIGEIYGNHESGYYLKMSGTSGAAPHVSAAAALYQLKNPAASGMEITNHLRNTARDLGAKGYDIYYGWGLLDAEKALSQKAAAIPGRSTVSLKNKGIRSIQVSWSPASAAEGYDVYRASGLTGEYKKIRTVSASGSRSFLDKGLETDTNYCYKVSAYKNINGKKVYGIASEPEFCATSALYMTLKGKAEGYKGIRLSWNRSKKAKGYILYRATKRTGPYKRIHKVGRKTTHYFDRKAVAGKKYYYRVKAYLRENGKTVYSDASNIVRKKTTLKRPALEARVEGGRALLSWNEVKGAQGYQIYRSKKKRKGYKKVDAIQGKSATSYASQRLKSGKRYYFKVRAYRKTAGKKGYGTFSFPKSVKR